MGSHLSDERITVVKPGVSDDVAWLTSPQRNQLESGSAECKPTARAIRQFDALCPAADPAPAAAAVALSEDDSVHSELGAEEEEEEEVVVVVVEEGAVLAAGTKRARKATAPFHPATDPIQPE